MLSKDIYAAPRVVTNIDECFFYHTMDIPGYGYVKGQWDLRRGFREYLGDVDFDGKRVLELGTADGFLCFQMEKQGAEVVAYDLSENQSWDIVPYSRNDLEQYASKRRAHIKRLNNAYWLCHRAYHSKAKMVYGSIYEIPSEIGPVDIATFGAVLLHVRDPFLALEMALRLTRETVIITEPLWKRDLVTRIVNKFIVSRHLESHMIFLPDHKRSEPVDTWWILPPDVIQRFIGVLGFEDTKVSYHWQKYEEKEKDWRIPFYTIVGRKKRRT